MLAEASQHKSMCTVYFLPFCNFCCQEEVIRVAVVVVYLPLFYPFFLIKYPPHNFLCIKVTESEAYGFTFRRCLTHSQRYDITPSRKTVAPYNLSSGSNYELRSFPSFLYNTTQHSLRCDGMFCMNHRKCCQIRATSKADGTPSPFTEIIPQGHRRLT